MLELVAAMFPEDIFSLDALCSLVESSHLRGLGIHALVPKRVAKDNAFVDCLKIMCEFFVVTKDNGPKLT